MRFLIKKVSIWNGGEGLRQSDILVENGVITRVETGMAADAAVIDGEGYLAAPGLFDMHVHLRFPGQTDKEDLTTGLKAAVKGGFTGVLAMANTSPPVDNEEVLQSILQHGASGRYAALYQAAALTTGMDGRIPAEFDRLKNAGAVAFSDDGRCVAGAAAAEEAFRQAARTGLAVLVHEEDPELSSCSGWSFDHGDVVGVPAEAETLPALRDVVLAAITGVHLHIQHVSAALTVRWLRKVKPEARVTLEATPHHLLFSVDNNTVPDPDYKVNPPIRSESDRQELLQAVEDGVIDVIATDHAPHTAEEKNRPFDMAPAGINWLEVAFPALYTRLVLTKALPLDLLLNAMVVRPREILGLEVPRIAEDRPAEFSLFNLAQAQTAESRGYESKGQPNPLSQTELYGFADYVFFRGKMMMAEGRLRV